MKITRKEATNIVLQNNQWVINNYSSECSGMCTLSSMLCLIDNIYDDFTKSQWIFVKDKLPECKEDNSTVVLASNGFTLGVFSFSPNRDHYYEWRNVDSRISYNNITHWMPLPELPKIKK